MKSGDVVWSLGREAGVYSLFLDWLYEVIVHRFCCMLFIKTFLLFSVTALAEIIGCYLPYYWLRKSGPIWVLIPAAISLVIFAWLLTLHPSASGRVYAAYGCVYVVTALAWLKVVDGMPLSTSDIVGGAVALLGMLIIISGWGKVAV